MVIPGELAHIGRGKLLDKQKFIVSIDPVCRRSGVRLLVAPYQCAVLECMMTGTVFRRVSLLVLLLESMRSRANHRKVAATGVCEVRV